VHHGDRQNGLSDPTYVGHLQYAGILQTLSG